MSIWATSLVVAADDHADGCTRLVREPGHGSVWREDPTRPCTCHAGPIVYQGSHVMPADGDPRGGWFDLAEIPGFIRRDGQDADGDDDPSHPWLRVGMRSARGDGVVVLTRDQVARIHAYLGGWLELTEGEE